jgi:ferredoxin-NADP reductase
VKAARNRAAWETAADPPGGSPTDLNIVLRVLERRAESTNAESLFFERPRGFRFDPGDWIDIRFPSLELAVGRTYSISSAPSEPDLRITYRHGVTPFKRALRATEPGDTLLITQFGSNGFKRDPRRPVAMIAGGIGVAPFRSMIRDAIDAGRSEPIELLYVNRTPDFPFEAELRGWERETRWLRIRTLITGSGTRLGRDALTGLLPIAAATDPAYLVAGPPAMVDRTRDLLTGLGVAELRITVDRFEGY